MRRRDLWIVDEDEEQFDWFLLAAVIGMGVIAAIVWLTVWFRPA